MAEIVLRTEVDAEDLIRGLTLLGTGGGGRPELGREYLKDALSEKGEIRIRDVSAIPDEAWFCSTFGMGSTAPRPAVAALPGYGPKVVRWPMVEALRELERYAGLTISGIVAFELGAGNTAGPLHAATLLGLQFPDKVWFKNENHITWLDDRIHVTSPDLICVVRREDGEPVTNTVLAPGTPVAILGAKADWYRTPQGLRALGPRHFGFDVEYRPIEEIMGGR